MRIGILSDTHGHTHRTLDAVRLFETFEIEQILHCGDVGSVEIPPLLARWPGHFVEGNVDRHLSNEWNSAMQPGQTWHGLFADLTLGDRRVAMTHGHEPQLLNKAIASGDYDLVCYGHTHQTDQRCAGRTLVLNPGAIYRASIPSCAVVDLERLSVDILPI